MSVKKRILIVEDNRQEAEYLERVLSVRYETQIIGNGKDAFTLLRTGHEFDLMILDIRMPGLTGDQLLKDLRRIGDATEVLILTAYDANDIALATLSDGAFDYLLKPIAKERLLAKVVQALEAAELKRSEDVAQIYQHRRNHFNRTLSQALSHSGDFDDYLPEYHQRRHSHMDRSDHFRGRG